MDEWQYKMAGDLGMPITERARSLHRENGLIAITSHLFCRTLIGCYLRAYHGLRIDGREHLPVEPPFILAANHSSHLDALVLGTAISWRLCHRVFPIAAGDVFFDKGPSAVFAAGVLNALPLWRRKFCKQALQDLRRRLHEEPCGYIIFPEGTRSRDGVMTDFKAGLGGLIAESGVPVVPCHIDGAHRALPPGARWPRWRKIHLRIGPPLKFDQAKNDRAGWDAIAGALEGAVRNLAPRVDETVATG